MCMYDVIHPYQAASASSTCRMHVLCFFQVFELLCTPCLCSGHVIVYLGQSAESGVQKKSKKGTAAQIITVTAHGGEMASASGEKPESEARALGEEVPKSPIVLGEEVPNSSEGKTHCSVRVQIQMVNISSILSQRRMQSLHHHKHRKHLWSKNR